MLVKPVVGGSILCKTAFHFRLTCLRNEQDGTAAAIKGESHPPDPIPGIESQLLHVRMSEAV